MFGVKGKYFHIKNKGNGHMLSVKDGSKDPGALVQTWVSHDNDNQVWYKEPLTGTIRNRNNDMCLDIDGPYLDVLDRTRNIRMNPYDAPDPNQKWVYNKDKSVIENVANPVLVLGVDGDGPGAPVKAQEVHGKNSQKWTLNPLPVRYFRIVSVHSGKVLDVSGGRGKVGAKVIMYTPHPKSADNQLWYEDVHGNIRSKLSDKLVLDASSGTLLTGTYEPGKNRNFWVPHNGKIVNKDNPAEVLEVKKANFSDGAELGPVRFTGANNQLWTFEFV